MTPLKFGCHTSWLNNARHPDSNKTTKRVTKLIHRSGQEVIFCFGFAEHSRSCFTCQPCISHGKPERRCRSPWPEQINAETTENELSSRQNPSHPSAIATSTMRMEIARFHRSGRTKTKHPWEPPIRRPAGTQRPKGKRGASGERSPPEKQWPGRH